MKTEMFLIVLDNMITPPMTTLRIIERRNPDTDRIEHLLHIHVPRKKTVLILVAGMVQELHHLETTIDDPVPMKEGGDNPLEIRIDEDGTKHIYTNVGGPNLVKVEQDNDLEVLRQTINQHLPNMVDAGVV